MTNIHDLIDNNDIPGLIQYLHLKSVNEINKPNEDGIYPIEYVISKFNPEKNINAQCVMIQTLLNKGCEIDITLLNEIKNEQDGKIKQFIEKVLEMKPNTKKNRFERHESMHSTRSLQTKSRDIINIKSDYSDQELLQLQQHADKNGVLKTPTNHLALRIIKKLERDLESYGHYN